MRAEHVSVSHWNSDSRMGWRRADPRPLTMPEQIADSVTEAILRGEFQPGDPVREQELADQFKVSRGPIREALRILEKAGVVSIVPQRGAHVTHLSAAEVNNLFEIRTTLAPLLALHLDFSDLKLLRAIQSAVNEMEGLAKSGSEWRAYAQASYRLSRLLFGSSSNPQLCEILESLATQTARYSQLGLHDPKRQRASAQGWKRFAEAFAHNDPQTAGEELANLMDTSRQAVLKVFTK